jgi:Xaa-Pro aminopeptidase
LLGRKKRKKNLTGLFYYYFILADAETLNKSLSSKNSELVSLSQNLVDTIWEDRPARPASLVFHLEEKYSGKIIHSPPPFFFVFSD